MPNPTANDPLHQRFQELEKYGADPEGPVARMRGNAFEKLLLDLLQHHKLLLRRSFHTVDNKMEQIDGAINLDGRVALIEAKWTSESVAASELYAFLGKVEGKFIGTVGIFVSRTPLSPNFLRALRAGRRQSVIVIHGDDVPTLFQPGFALKDYLLACIHHVSIDNDPHLSAQTFLATKEQEVASEKASNKSDVMDILKTLDTPNPLNMINALVAPKDKEVLEDEVTALLQVFPKVLLGSLATPHQQATIPKYIAEGTRQLPDQEVGVDTLFFGTILPTILSLPDYVPIIDAFAPRIAYISLDLAQKVNQAIVDAWNKASGSFDDENRLVDSTDTLWPNLSEDAKRKLLGKFIDILNSYYHRPGYPQFKLAEKIVNSRENIETRDQIIIFTLKHEYSQLLHDEDSSDENLRGWAWKSVVSSFRNANGRITGLEEVVSKAKLEVMGYECDIGE